MQTLHIDNSKRSSYATCPRKFFLRYVKHLTSIYGSPALRYGSTWHALMEGYYSSIISNPGGDHVQAAITLGTEVYTRESEGLQFFDDYRTLEACFQSFVQYLEVFQNDLASMRIIASERIFDIGMDLTPQESRTYENLANFSLHFTGKLDLEVSLQGQHYINEFKTTGQPIQLQASRLQRSAQILGYTWAAKKLGNDIVGTLVSVHQLSGRKTKDGTYGKLTREFLRQPNIFSEADLASWRESYLYTCDQIAHSTLTQNFPCQYDSCYQFGKCAYTQLCEQNRPFEELNLTGYITKEWNVLESGTSKNLDAVVAI